MTTAHSQPSSRRGRCMENKIVQTASASDNVLDSDLVALHTKMAMSAHKEYSEKKASLEQAMLDWPKSRVTPGMVVDLSHENHRAGNVSKYMSDMRVVRGNTRKSKKFRIESVLGVDIDMRHLSLSSWTCLAAPISNLTGEVISGRVAKSLSYGKDCDKDLVSLRFSFFRDD